MRVTFTDQNFEEQVVKASGTTPVLVDFHAEWCVAPNTAIILTNGGQTKASEVTTGQKLLGLADSLDSGVVTKSFVTRGLGHCRKIVLNTGREVEVTDDHLLYGSRGWTASSHLKVGEKLAVLPSSGPFPGGAAPVRDLVLARLTGLLFTDGTLYHQEKNHYWEVGFTLGQQRDVQGLDDDLRFLGFTNVRVSEVTKQQRISGRKFTTHVFRVKCLSKELFGLMKSLGVPVGAKKSQRYNIPAWIKNGRLEVKREFLRGFFGGDGPKVDMSMVERKRGLPYNQVGLNDLEFHKDLALEQSGLGLAYEITKLLGEFGVTVDKVFAEKDSYIRQDGQMSSIIHLRFRKDFETALNLVSKIGYAYSWQKEGTSQLTGEFLRQIFVLKDRWQSLYKQAMGLAAKGLGYRRVSRTLGIAPLRAFLWIKGRRKATIFQHGIKFDQWLAEALKNAPAGFIWERIEKIEPVFLPAVTKITVDRTNSFIANGILSHNCGPCKMIDPILDELSNAYAGKMTVGSLDVDANQQTAAKFGVMSIPTLIFFKNGQPVKQSVGYQDKVTLQKQFDEILAS